MTATNPAGSSSQTSSSALDVPPAAVDDERTVAEDSSATQLDPLDNDDDGGDGGPVEIASASDPAHGTVGLTGGTSGAHTGLTYEPDADYCNDAPANPTDDFTYTLNGGSTATVAVAVTCVVDDSLYWTNKGGGGAVRYMGLNPATGPDDLVGGQGDNGPCGMALDPAAGKAYWAHFEDDRIRRADLDDGDAVEDVVTEPPGSEPCGMAIDPVAGRIYWANSATGQIRVADLDPGTDDASNLATGQEAPTGVAIDPVPGNPAAGRIYWTNVGSSTIRFADLDPGTGDAPQTLATGPANGLNAPLGLAIDPVAGDPSAGRAYVANLSSNQILVMDLDPGTNDVAELAGGQNGPAGVAIDPVAGDPSAGRAYWANFLGGTLARADLAPGNGDTPQNLTGGESNPTFPALLREPQGTGPPVTSPTGGGDELSCSHGDWAPDLLGAYLYRAPQSFARQWLKDGVEIPDETGATFTPTEPGDYTCTVTATNRAGSRSQTSAVQQVDIPPTAVNDTATVDEDADPTTINVLGNDTDTDGGPKAIDAVTQPDDGTVAVAGDNQSLTYKPNAGYCNDGDPTDNFTYTLNGGSTATVAVTVNCADDGPTAVNDTATVDEDADPTTINVLGNDTDTDGGPKAIDAVTQPDDGTVAVAGDNQSLTYKPNAGYCNDGDPTDNFTYTLNGGSTATVAVTVNCADDGPTAVNDTATVDEDADPTTINVLGNDTDTDGGPKAIDAVTQPDDGTVAVAGDNQSLTYKPNAGYCNDGDPTDNFTYTLNGGSTATVAVTVNCADDGPTAVNDTATVDEDADPTTINVLGNDTDTDGGPKAIDAVTQPDDGTVAVAGDNQSLTYKPNAGYCNDGDPTDNFTYTLNGGSTATVAVTVNCADDGPTAVNDTATVDEDADPTTINVLGNDTDTDGGPKAIDAVTQPDDGTVAVAGDNQSLTYKPNAGYCNDGDPTDNFTYTLNGGSTATVAVTVNCADDGPTAVNDTATVDEDADPTTINVLDNDTDTDGGPKAIDAVTQPDDGTVAVAGDNQSLTYKPNAGYCNDGDPTDNFTYTLNGGSTATVAVTVNCADDGPTAVNDTATVDEDADPTTIDVLANDTDTDGGPKAIDAVTQPDDGTVAVAGDNQSLTYKPNAGYCNDGDPTDNFTYTLNGGSTATVAVTVNCADDGPTAVNDTATVDEDADPTTIDVLDNDTDTDGGPKAIDAVTQPDDGTVAVAGDNQSLTYKPNAGYCNDGDPTDNFTYTLNGGSTATVAVTVNCADDGPTAVNDTATVDEDADPTTINVLGNDTDTDGGPKAIDAVTQPDDGTVAVAGDNQSLTYKPNAGYCNDGDPTDNFTYTLNGGSTATVAVTVNCADDGPTITDTDPDSPSNDRNPEVKGTAGGGNPTQVRLYKSANCSGGVAATGTVAQFTGAGITVNVAKNSTTNLSARAFNAAGNGSICSNSISYINDSTAPAKPTLTDTDPDSPANDIEPEVKGTVGGGNPTQVKLYKSANCSGSVAATGTVAQFTGAGITVNVPNGSTTNLSARATDAAGNDSACSNSISYVELDGSIGAPTITDTDPDSPANDRNPEVKGTVECRDHPDPGEAVQERELLGQRRGDRDGGAVHRGGDHGQRRQQLHDQPERPGLQRGRERIHLLELDHVQGTALAALRGWTERRSPGL